MPEQAFQKAKYYCAYQERSHAEVQEKLYGLGLRKTTVEQLISRLIEGNYLNEERFAIQFAGGKFRMKKWGRVKIEYELKQKRISPYCIKKALNCIPEEDYKKTLHELVSAQWKKQKNEKNRFIKLRKTMDYVLQKGYERNQIMEYINQLQEL